MKGHIYFLHHSGFLYERYIFLSVIGMETILIRRLVAMKVEHLRISFIKIATLPCKMKRKST